MYKQRPAYIEKIKPHIGNKLIKVLTGMRRVGKSYLLKLIIEEIKKDKAANIVFIDKESASFDFIENQKDLNQYLKENLKTKKKNYLFIDEVQEIQNWEKSLRSLLKNDNAEIFITGSNAYMLSSELATFIAGRYIEIPVYPLSFREFLDFRNKTNKNDIDKEFDFYLRYGSMPGIHNLELNEEVSFPMIQAIFNTVILKEVVAKNQIRNYALFEKILNFVLDNIGSTFSAKAIVDFFKSQKTKASLETIQSYLHFLEAAFLIYKVQRYDIKGKKLLEIYEKYYVTDLAFRHTQLGYREGDINDFLENLVFLELKRLGYTVSIGKLNNKEIDFIATKTNEKIYIQVAYLLSSQEVIDREFAVLQRIPDNHPKYVISMDKFFGESFAGIKRLNIIDFLKSCYF